MSVSLPPGLASFRPPSPIPRELSPSPIPALPSREWRDTPVPLARSRSRISLARSRSRISLARSPSPIPAPPSPRGPPFRIPKEWLLREERGTPVQIRNEGPSEAQDPKIPGQLPELVRDARLDTTVQGTTTIHRRIVRRRGAPQEERWIRHDDNILGHGGGGLVWLEHKVSLSETDPSERRAVKAIRVPGGRSITEGLHYVRELEALAKFSQERYAEFFVRFAGWYEVPNYLCISMEYCEHGDLKRYLESAKTLPEDEARDVASQVLCALAMMHQEGFAHRDVKPANILIKSKPPDGWWVKVCDLGLTKRAEDITGSTTVRGTPGFWAPETLGFNGHPQLTDARPTDMWCFGETVFQMLAGHPTFESVADLYRYDTGLRSFPLEALGRVHASDNAQHFVQTLMAADPSRRPSAQATQGHSWIRPSAQAVDDYASSRSAVPTSNQAEGAWPPSMPTRHPEEFTQASGQWTGTVTMQGRMRSAAVYPATSFALPVYGHGPAGQAGLYPPFSPVNGYKNGGMRSHRPLIVPPPPFVFSPAVPWDGGEYQKYLTALRAEYDKPLGSAFYPPPSIESWSHWNPTRPTTEVSPPVTNQGTDRRPTPASPFLPIIKSWSPWNPTLPATAANPPIIKQETNRRVTTATPATPASVSRPSGPLAGRALPAREKDNSQGRENAPKPTLRVEDIVNGAHRRESGMSAQALSKLNDFERQYEAQMERFQRKTAAQDRSRKSRSLKESAEAFKVGTPVSKDPPVSGVNEGRQDSSKPERSGDETAEEHRAFSKTLSPGVPDPEFHPAPLAKEAREKTTTLRSARDLDLEELRAFSETFQLRTPIYNDLKSQLAKDPAEQQELVAKQESILSQQREATVSPRLQADKGIPSEAPAPDQPLPPAGAASTEPPPASPLEAQDPSIEAVRPAPRPTLATAKTWAAVAAAGEGRPAGTAGKGDGRQLPLKKAKKGNRRKKRGGPRVPESGYDESTVWPDYID